jgi:hypothetical protein
MREGGSEEEDGEEGEREAVSKRMERKGEKGSEEDDYFNKFPPTMPSASVILTTSLPPSSSSLLISLLPLLFLLPLSLLPLPPPHCLSPSFLSILLLTTSPHSFLSIHFLITYLPPSSQSSSLLTG